MHLLGRPDAPPARKIIPAMLVGCTVVLKPSEVTPINAYLVAEVSATTRTSHCDSL